MTDLVLKWKYGGKTNIHPLQSERSITIGRRQDCEIVIPDKTISRRHARLTVTDKGVALHNLSSTNPIRLNKEVTVYKGQESILNAGDTIQLGKILIEIKDPSAAVNLRLKIKCSNCGKVVEETHKDCPWCGTSLAFGETVVSYSNKK